MNNPVSATLIAHAGTYKVLEDAVRAAIAPEPTASWNPISHGVLLDLVLDVMKEFKLLIRQKEFAMSHGSERMFATMTLESESKEYALALGIRNSTNKTMPAGICCGSRVFVCDNMAFSSAIVFGRRHTTHIMDDLRNHIKSAVQRFIGAQIVQDRIYKAMKDITVSMPESSEFLVTLVEEQIIPKNGLYIVRKEFKTPRYKEFQGNSLWSFYNALTTYCRHERGEVEPMIAQNTLLEIHRKIVTDFKLDESFPSDGNVVLSLPPPIV